MNVGFSEFVSISRNHNKFDLIVSSPPYIPTDEMDVLEPEVKQYEDELALHGGFDGLSLIKDIIEKSDLLLHSKGSNELWMEVARQHPAMIETYIKSSQNRGYQYLEGINDLSGFPRFVRLKLRSLL